MADPTVIEFHSRDLDSRISAREVAAVRDWQYSGKHFHVMRDNPAHTSRMLGSCVLLLILLFFSKVISDFNTIV